MSTSAVKFEPRFTWTDYRAWPDDERWELIAGAAYAMSPSPGSRHQAISVALTGGLFPFFVKGPCRLFAAPMDVRLSEEDVVQPDLLVVCDPSQIKPTHIEGPPRLAVEILSPHSHVQDRHRKTALYARCGVQEYWIVTPFPSLVELFVLADGGYRLWRTFARTDSLASPTFPALSLPLETIFDFPLEPAEQELLRVKEAPAPYSARGSGTELQ
jgi:Uma2 family endonuclease